MHRTRTSLQFHVLFLLLPVACDSASARELNGFDIAGSLIPPEAILWGGVARDGIPAINAPKFIPAEAALETYANEGRALVVRHKGEVKAYPLVVLDWHEVVNDTIGGQPIAVTWCPLCGTAVIFLSEVGRQRLRFGVSGLLYQSDVLLYDKGTESLWSQVRRQAITGKYKGTRLEVLPSTIEPLSAVAANEKNVQVLSTETGFRRDYRKGPYGRYARSPSLLFPVNHRDNKAALKAWSLIAIAGTDAVIVPLYFLDPEATSLTLKVGQIPVELTYDVEKGVLNCKDPPATVTCIAGYYFALRTFYPHARLHTRHQKKP